MPKVDSQRAIRWSSPTEQLEQETAAKLQKLLVDLNKAGKVGSKTVTFRIGSKAVQTDEAMKALLEGKNVKATAVQFKSARGSKMTGGSYYKAKVRVPGVKVVTFDNVKNFEKWAWQNVLKSPKDV